MDHQIRMPQKPDVTLVSGMSDTAVGVQERLMIGRIHHRNASARESIPARWRSVIEVLRLDGEASNVECLLVHGHKPDFAFEVVELDREMTVAHLPGERLLKILLETGRSIDRDLG